MSEGDNLNPIRQLSLAKRDPLFRWIYNAIILLKISSLTKVFDDILWHTRLMGIPLGFAYPLGAVLAGKIPPVAA